MRHTILAACASVLLLLPLSTPAEPTNDRALAGVESGKVVWNVTLDRPRALTLQMKVVRQTYQDLKEAGLDPRMVLAFHSSNVHFLTEDLSEVPMDMEEPVKRFNKQLDKLLKLDGVRVEACGLANEAFGVDNEAIRDGIDVAANSYVSLTGYQHKGYAIIGIH